MSITQFRGRVGEAAVVILTVLDEEFEAVKRMLDLTSRIPRTPYYRGPEAVAPWPVVLMQLNDRGNLPAMAAVKVAVEDFFPGYLFLVGIGGGVSNRDGVALGDVVVADYIDYAEFAKLQDGKVRLRKQPHDHPSLFLRGHIARAVRRSDWAAEIDAPRPDGGTTTPKALEGNLLAGEKIMSDPTNEYQRQIMEHFDKALVVEMEAFGFARATFEARRETAYNPQLLVIRGISDLVDVEDNNAQRALWKEFACSSAAAFAHGAVRELASVIDGSSTKGSGIWRAIMRVLSGGRQ